MGVLFVLFPSAVAMFDFDFDDLDGGAVLYSPGLDVGLPSGVLTHENYEALQVGPERVRPALRPEPALRLPPRAAPAAQPQDPSGFFAPEAYKAWADQWHADHPDDKRMHILFEARGKTELASAYELMKALASSGNYRVTLLTPGGQWVQRKVEGGAMKTLILEPGEALADGDDPMYDAALSARETAALEEAGVHVVFKSIFTNEKKWFELTLRVKQIPKDAIGWDWEGQRYGDDAWVDTVLPQLRADLPPVNIGNWDKRLKIVIEKTPHMYSNPIRIRSTMSIATRF